MLKIGNTKSIIVTIIMTFIWLTPYDAGRNYYWPVQILNFVVSCYYFFAFLKKERFYIDKKHSIFIYLFLFGASTVISCFINFDKGDIATQAIFTVKILGMFSFFYINGKKQIKSVINGVFITLFLYFVLDIIRLYRIGVGDIWSIKTYFTGGKFDVSYNIILLLMIAAIISVRRKKRTYDRILYKILVVISLIYFFKFDCMTGLVGAVVSLLTLAIMYKWDKLNDYKFVFVLYLASGVIVLLMRFILDLSVIQNIITLVLHRTANMTGRMKIYSQIMIVLKHSILFGNGQSTEYAVGLIGFYNMQNGLFQIIYRFGLSGAFFLSMSICVWIKEIYASKKKHRKIIISFFMGFLFCAIVEILFDTVIFYYFLAISYGIAKGDEATKYHQNGPYGLSDDWFLKCALDKVNC